MLCIGKLFSCVICAVVIVIIVAFAILIPFMVRTPDVDVESVNFGCDSFDSCTRAVGNAAVPVSVTIDVDNPNILSADVESDDIKVFTRDDNTQICTGTLNSTHISSRGHTTIVPQLSCPVSTKLTSVFRSLFIDNQPVDLHVTAYTKIDLGALDFHRDIDEDYTMPAQGSGSTRRRLMQRILG